MLTMVLFSGSFAMASVTLTDLGSAVTLDNGIVSATITKSTVVITSLKHNGDELLGNGGRGYIQQYFNDQFSTPSGATYSLVVNDPGFKDISFTWIVSGMEMELHYTMAENDSGIYSYVIATYDTSLSATTEMEQYNLVIRSDREIFGMHRGGAFAEFVNVPARCLTEWPESLSSTAACLAEPLASILLAFLPL